MYAIVIKAMHIKPEEGKQRESLICPWASAGAVIDPISFHFASNIRAVEDKRVLLCFKGGD